MCACVSLVGEMVLECYISHGELTFNDNCRLERKDMPLDLDAMHEFG